MASKKRLPQSPQQVQPVIKKQKVVETTTIKRSLRGVTKSLAFQALITKNVISITKFLKLGSLNVLCFYNNLVQNGTDDEINNFFRQKVDKNFFDDYFRGMDRDSIASPNANGFKLFPAIRTLCQKYEVNAPSTTGLTNSLKFGMQQFYTCFENNMWMHAYSRMKRFLLHINSDRKKVHSTLEHLFKEKSSCKPDQDLLDAIVAILRPIDWTGGKGYFFGMKSNWHKFIPLFIRLQRFVLIHFFIVIFV